MRCVLVDLVTHYVTLHQLILEPSCTAPVGIRALFFFFFPTMAHKGACKGGNRHASIGDVYKLDDQLTACLQRLEEQFDRIDDQF